MVNRSDIRQTGDLSFSAQGESLVATPEGALYWPARNLLVVSDLHLEKGSSFARRGQMLPPYDTRATLRTVAALMDRFRPAMVLSLGDSFHDPRAFERLDGRDRATLVSLTSATDWVWIEGNHDPVPPEDLGGRGTHELRLGPFIFRHEPTGAAGEVAGHLHPAAKVAGRGRSVRRRCFATDGEALIMPAMGAYTGGLNVTDAAFGEVFSKGLLALVLGGERVFAVGVRSLLPDQARPQAVGGQRWRL